VKLGLNLGYWSRTAPDPAPLARQAEALGYDSVWVAEAYGSDAVTLLAWIAAKTERIRLGSAVLQIPARTPALAAMTAATLDHLSGGRLILGLGVSGPQVVEGWHGVAYGKPLGRTREYVEIVRAILRRERPLEHHGEHYDIPLRGGTGLGKPIKLILHPLRREIPIYLAAIGPRNVALAAEIADGWLPMFFSPYRRAVFEQALAEGLARRPAERGASPLEIAPTAIVALGDDLARCRAAVKPTLALYLGGMGAAGRNFYYDLACRYGYQAAAQKIQAYYLSGQKEEAVASVPDELVDEVALCGPKARIRERLQVWKEAGVSCLICGTADPGALRTLAELLL
jgi:F420-dependent oxidoreductase-like protein